METLLKFGRIGRSDYVSHKLHGYTPPPPSITCVPLCEMCAYTPAWIHQNSSFLHGILRTGQGRPLDAEQSYVENQTVKR